MKQRESMKLVSEIPSIKTQLDYIVSLNTLQAIKSKQFNVGDRIHSSLYGGSIWIVKNSIICGEGVVDFDDELHQIVNLKGGGTGVAECQINSVIDYAKTLNTKAYSKLQSKLQHNQTSLIGMMGDSIFYGQYTGEDAVIKIDQPTNFGDGSVYRWNQIPNPAPKYLENTLREVYGNNVAVKNLGFSGDKTCTSYARHRINNGLDACIINLATNDIAWCTDNGVNLNKMIDDNNRYSLKPFIEWYRKIIVREMLRGSSVILCTPHRISTEGFAKGLRQYENATKQLGLELGIPVVIGNEFFADYPNGKVCFDGTHLTDFGCQVYGKRLASLFIGRGYSNSDRVLGERHIVGDIFIENLSALGKTTQLANANSFGNQGKCIGLFNNEKVHYSFYLEEDIKYFMPICVLKSASFKYKIDFGLDQPELKLDKEVTDDVYLATIPPSEKIIGDVNNSLIKINSLDDIQGHLCIQGKGWHTVTVECTSPASAGYLSGFRFFDEGKIPKVVVGEWVKLPLLNGIYDSSRISDNKWIMYKVNDDNTVSFKGLPSNETPTNEKVMCDLPTVLATKLHNTYKNGYIFTTFNGTQIQMLGTQMIWKTSVNLTCNISEVKLYFTQNIN